MDKPVIRQYTTLELSGSWEDIGRAQARNFPDEIMQSRALFRMIFGITEKDFTAYYEQIRRFVPANVQTQMDAMAEELAKIKKIPLKKATEAVMAWNIGYDIVQKQKDDRIAKRQRFIKDEGEPAGCSAWAFVSDESLIMAHITDAPPQAEGGTLIHFKPNTGEIGYLSFFAPGNVGVGLGINEEKLCITYNVGRPNRGAEAGLPGLIMAREALTRCTTVDDAVALFREHLDAGGSFAHQGVRFLIGSFKENKAVDLQLRSREMQVSQPKPLRDGVSYLAFTNHFEPEFATLNAAERNENANISSLKRRERLEEMLQESTHFDVARCFEIATDHNGMDEGNNNTLCRHGTASISVIVNVFTADTAYYTVGQTCKYIEQYGAPKEVSLARPVIPALEVSAKDGAGAPAKYQKLYLHSFDVKGTADTLATDAQGLAVFNNLEAGTYIIGTGKKGKRAVKANYDGVNLSRAVVAGKPTPQEKKLAKAVRKDQKAGKFLGLDITGGLRKLDFRLLLITIMLSMMFSAANSVLISPYLSGVIGLPSDSLGKTSTLMTNVAQISMLFFAGYTGALSDRMGRKKVIAIGFLLIALANIVFVVAPGIFGAVLPVAGLLAIAVVMRSVSGVSNQMANSSLMALMSDYTTAKDKSQGMTLYSMASGISAILANGVYTSVMAQMGVLAGFVVSIIVALSGLTISVFLLRNNQKTSEAAKKTRFKDILPILKRSKAMKASYLAAFCTRTDIMVITAMLVIWATKSAAEYGLTAATAPSRVVLPIILSSIVSLFAFPIFGIMMDRIGKIRTLKISTLIAMAGFLLIALTKNPFSPIMLLPAVLISIGFAGETLVPNAIVTQVAPRDKTGAAVGGLNMMQPIGMILFMAVGGILLDAVGMWAVALFKLSMNLIVVAYLEINKASLSAEV